MGRPRGGWPEADSLARSGLTIQMARRLVLGLIESADQIDLALMPLVLECTRHCQPWDLDTAKPASVAALSSP